MRRTLLIYFIFWAYIGLAQTTEITELKSNWYFKNPLDNKYYSAQVPAMIYKNLLDHHIIPDPFKASNESKVQWVEHRDWEYLDTFIVSSSTLSKKHQELHLEGLDTYTEVYINQHLLIKTNNAFRVWTVSVKDELHVGKNVLRIVFHSASDFARAKCKEAGFMYPADSDADSCRTSVFTRKPAMHYGWDFAPRLCGPGITGRIKLISWNDFRIQDAWIACLKSSKQSSRFRLYADVYKSWKTLTCTIRLMEKNKPILAQMKLNPNDYLPFTIDFDIPNVKQWNVFDENKTQLYEAECEISDGIKSDKKIIRFGARTIELVEESIAYGDSLIGSSFYFKLNDKKFFSKGVNVVPFDFVHHASYDYLPFLMRMKDAHVNMIRIWGGGGYADEQFYNLCDSLGILIWQDLPFANSFYPDERRFNINVTREILQQMNRLMRHPSLAIVCGNNEIEVAMKNWGWKQSYHYPDSTWDMLCQQYYKRFNIDFPVLFHSLPIAINYIPTSPLSNWGKATDFVSGDNHYWGIWHGEANLEEFQNHVAPFISEYGFPSFPSTSAMLFIKDEANPVSDSEIVSTHMKSYKGNRLLKNYLNRYYPETKTIDDDAWVSQLLQADAVKEAISAHRSSEYCSGTLLWQGNDFWPGTTWSILDWNGDIKPAYHQMKKMYQPKLITIQNQKQKIQIHLKNEDEKGLIFKGKIQILDFIGREIYQEEISGYTPSSDLSKVWEMPLSKLPSLDSTRHFLYVSIYSANGDTLNQTYFFARTKNLKLSKTKPEIRIVKNKQNGTYRYEITSNELIKGLYLYHPDIHSFSDNGVDILPNIPFIVNSLQETSITNLHENLIVHCLNELFER